MPAPTVRHVGVEVRAAERDDVGALVELWQALSADGHAADQRYQVRRDAVALARTFVVQQWLRTADHHVVVAVDEAPVGFVTVRMSPAHPVLEPPPTAVVTDAYVAPSRRRTGVGARLFDGVRAWSLERGVEQLEVGTLALDQRAVAFWRALGFGDWRVVLARPATA
jgi:GNAT superfamily N-acetyltransferase